MSTIINFENYKNKKIDQKGKLLKIPMYSIVYMEGNKLIGEFESGRSEVIKTYKE